MFWLAFLRNQRLAWQICEAHCFGRQICNFLFQEDTYLHLPDITPTSFSVCNILQDSSLLGHWSQWLVKETN